MFDRRDEIADSDQGRSFQAFWDLLLYVVFFLPGIFALSYAGWIYANESLAIREQTFSPEPLPLYPFKFVIPLAGAVVLLQGLSEMLRCVECIRTGAWLPRLKDAQEMDVVGQQLGGAGYADDEARREAIARAHQIDETARQRGAGGREML